MLKVTEPTALKEKICPDAIAGLWRDDTCSHKIYLVLLLVYGKNLSSIISSIQRKKSIPTSDCLWDK
jgi:hypothetical protein